MVTAQDSNADLEYAYLTQVLVAPEHMTNGSLLVDSSGWANAGIGGDTPVRADVSAASPGGNAWAFSLGPTVNGVSNSGRMYNPNILNLVPGDHYRIRAWIISTGNWQFYVRGPGAIGVGALLAANLNLQDDNVWREQTLDFEASDPTAQVVLLANGGTGQNPVGTIAAITGVRVNSLPSADFFTLPDLRNRVYGPNQHAYFSSLSGLTPVFNYSLADHKRAYYRAQLGATATDPRTLSDLQRAFWKTALGL